MAAVLSERFGAAEKLNLRRWSRICEFCRCPDVVRSMGRNPCDGEHVPVIHAVAGDINPPPARAANPNPSLTRRVTILPRKSVILGRATYKQTRSRRLRFTASAHQKLGHRRHFKRNFLLDKWSFTLDLLRISNHFCLFRILFENLVMCGRLQR